MFDGIDKQKIDWRLLGRWSLLFAALIWGVYILLSIRTMSYGRTGPWVCADLFATSVFVAPVALLACLGMSRRRLTLNSLLICLTSLIISESFAELEEAFFRRSCRNSSPPPAVILKNRWRPFAHHVLFYDSERHVFGGDD